MNTREQKIINKINRKKHEEKPIYDTPRHHQQRLAAKIATAIDRRFKLAHLPVFVDQFGEIGVCIETSNAGRAQFTINRHGEWRVGPSPDSPSWWLWHESRTGTARNWRKAVRTLVMYVGRPFESRTTSCFDR